MTEKITNEYRPDQISIPGETLAEVLEERGMSQAELAERMGRPKKTINEIVKGKAEITSETALQLERVLGIPTQFWTRLEGNYRDYIARREEEEKLLQQVEWVSNFPVFEMQSFGFLPESHTKIDRVRAILSFFGVSSVQQWKTRYAAELAAFRLPQKLKPNIYALTAWLRQGEREAQGIECAPFDASLFRAALRDARALTTQEADRFTSELTRSCARCGVAVVFIRELKGLRACGATRWLSPQKALIQLSLRYKSNDQLWFTFFHEAAHVLLHGKREAFVEIFGASTGDHVREEEANQFAADLLIPPKKLSAFLDNRPFSAEKIRAFAEGLGIAAGIVVGRLQHDRHIPYDHLNGLKVRYRWVATAD